MGCKPHVFCSWLKKPADNQQMLIESKSFNRVPLAKRFLFTVMRFPLISRMNLRENWRGRPIFDFSNQSIHSRERLRRVLRKKAAVILHLQTFTSADLHLHTFTSADLHLTTSSHLHICWSTSSHLHICWSTSSHLHTCRSRSSHLHTCRSRSSHLQI